MASWTNHEIRRLREMYASGEPSPKMLAAAFPRHPYDSIYWMTRQVGLRPCRGRGVHVIRVQYWLRVVHEHFSRREAGWLA